MSDWTSDGALDAAVFPTKPTDSRAAWAAVASLSLGVFGLVTAEFLPASILPAMAQELGVSHGTAGQAVTATAVMAALAGPLLVLGAGRLDRRLLVLGLSTLLILSSLASAFAQSIETLLVARAVLGFALGGFWAMVAALALRLVPSEMVPRAMAVIFTGVSVATVCAAPLGALISDIWNWRVTFWVASGIGVVTLAAQLLFLPRLPAAAAPGLASFGIVLRRPAVLVGVGTVLLAVSGHFAGFTFVRPFLEEVPQMAAGTISMALLAFGIGGFLGNLVGGAVASRSPRLGAGGGMLLLGTTAAVLLLFGSSEIAAFGAIAAWGFAFGTFPVSISSWNARVAPDHAESAGAVLSASFQVAIATGAILGGLLVDGIGPTGVITYAVAVVLAGALLMLLGGARAMR